MRNKILVLALIPLFAACKLDVLGPGSLDWGNGAWGGGWSGGGGSGWPTPDLEISGALLVDGYMAEPGEAAVYFYEPSDTLVPVDSAAVDATGRYRRTWWGAEDLPDVCDWLGQAVLWSGETSELKSLFDPTTQPCLESSAYQGGATLRVEYEPLATPFVLSGTVLIDDTPGQLEVALPTRIDPGAYTPLMTVVSDEEGIYRISTTDAVQRFTWCQWVYAAANGPGGVQLTSELGQIHDMAGCVDGRTLPDIRFGAQKAVSGHVQIAVAPEVYRQAGPGEAEATLLDPAGTTAVLGPVETLDDGSFHMWWPAGGVFPGCDFLLRTELEDGRSVEVRMIETSQGCAPGVQRWVQIP